MGMLENRPAKSLNESFPDVSEHIGFLTFNVISATVNSTFGHTDNGLEVGKIPSHEKRRCVVLIVEYDSTRLLGGVSAGTTKLKDMFGRCVVIQRPEDRQSGFTVGRLDHRPSYAPGDPLLGQPHPESYGLEIYLPDDQLNEMIVNLQTGKLPTLSVGVRGMSLRTEFELAWDVKTDPVLPIISFESSFVTAVDYELRKNREPFSIPEEKLYFQPNKADLGLVLQAVNDLSQLTQQVTGKLQWIFYGMLVLIIAIIGRALFG